MTLFDEYGAYHTDPRNRLCHEIGIPLIVLGIAALLRLVWVPGWNLNLAGIALLALFFYYVWLRLMTITEMVAVVCALLALYYVAGFLTWPWAIAAFAVGWVFQFVGHAYEGKAPAFLTNLVHLLVGPLWVVHILVRRRASS